MCSAIFFKFLSSINLSHWVHSILLIKKSIALSTDLILRIPDSIHQKKSLRFAVSCLLRKVGSFFTYNSLHIKYIICSKLIYQNNIVAWEHLFEMKSCLITCLENCFISFWISHIMLLESFWNPLVVFFLSCPSNFIILVCLLLLW